MKHTRRTIKETLTINKQTRRNKKGTGRKNKIRHPTKAQPDKATIINTKQQEATEKQQEATEAVL